MAVNDNESNDGGGGMVAAFRNEPRTVAYYRRFRCVSPLPRKERARIEPRSIMPKLNFKKMTLNQQVGGCSP